MAIMMATTFLLTACGDDEELPTPQGLTLEVTADEAENGVFTGFAGDVVTTNYNVTAPEGFTELIIFRVVDGDEEELERVTRANVEQTSESGTFEYTLRSEDVGNDVTLVFEAYDRANTQRTAEITVVAEAAPSARYSAVLLAAPMDNLTSKTFFSSNLGETFSMNDVNTSSEPVSANIDFGYFFGQTSGATLAAPSIYPIEYGQENWTVRNATQIRRTNITASEYIELGSLSRQELMEIFDNGEEGTNPGQIRNIAPDQVLVFATDDSKDSGTQYGLVFVESISEGTGSTGNIQIEVLVSQ